MAKLNLSKALSLAKKNGRPLSDYDIKFLLDRSGSMGGTDCQFEGKSVSRWQYGRETIQALAEAAQVIDTDGISVGFFDHEFTMYENTVPDVVGKVFSQVSPRGSTKTDVALNKVFRGYLEARDGTRGFFGKKPSNPKPIILVVMTDGIPDSESATKSAIIDFTHKLKSKDEFAISFIQVGYNSDAKSFLKSLDDDLKTTGGAKFDIVDTLTIDDVKNLSIEEFLLKALTD